MENKKLICLDNLLNILLKLVENRLEYESSYSVSNIIPECTSLLLVPLLNAALSSVERLNDEQMIILEKITIMIMRNINSKEQATVLRKYYSNITPSILDSPGVFPLVAIFGNARPELGDEMDFNKMIHILLGTNTASSLRKQYRWICISSIINKFKMGNIIIN